jgi:hypothetical protein
VRLEVERYEVCGARSEVRGVSSVGGRGRVRGRYERQQQEWATADHSAAVEV